MRSDIVSKILKETPIDIRVKVTIQAFFLNKNGLSPLIPLDENGDDNKEYLKKVNETLEECDQLIKWVLENIEDWKKDGMPE